MSNRHSVRKIAFGAALFGAFGYVASAVGKSTKAKKNYKSWINTASSEIDKAEDRIKFLFAEIDELILSTKSESRGLDGKNKLKFEAAIEQAKATKKKLGQLLEAIKDGESGDKDLNKVIKEAEKVILHTKNFLLNK